MPAVLQFFAGHSDNYQVSPPRPGKKYAVEFAYENVQDMALLADHGYLGFDDFWKLPHYFVDEVNYRRGGWSGVSRLVVGAGESSATYFVKRQENQYRYSLQHPLGRMTFEIEADAIRNAHQQQLPCVDIACWGVRRASGSSRAVLVTRAIDDLSLAQVMQTAPDWEAWLPALKTCGEQLYRMHALGIRHGALYPNHIFLNASANTVRLIDFEGSRQCRSINSAMQPDLQQLLKRLGSMPAPVRAVLLKPYMDKHMQLINAPLRALAAA